MSERLTDEQVAEIIRNTPPHDTAHHALAREVQEGRAYQAISHEAEVCREVTRQRADTIRRLSAECDALTADLDAVRALLNGGPCPHLPPGGIHLIPCPDCIDGRVPGIAKRLEATQKCGMGGPNRCPNCRRIIAATIADLGRATGGEA